MIPQQEVQVATKTKAAVVETDDEDVEELDDIEETAEASEESAPKKAKKAKPERTGTSVKDFAAELNMAPVRLRRILRSMERFSDNTYTRYDLSEEDKQAVRDFIATSAQAAEARKAEKAKNKAANAEASEDAGEELEDLEDADEDVDEDEDEDEEE